MFADNLASEQHDVLALLLSQLNDFVVVACDEQCIIRSWNEGIGARLGYSADEIVGRPFSDILARRDAQEAQVLAVRAKAGTSVMMSVVSIAMRPLFGGADGFIKVLRNVTSLNDTEAASRSLMEALEHSNILIRRWDGLIEHWSAGCERLYGYTSEEAVGSNLQDLLQTDWPLPVAEMEAQFKRDRSWRGELKQIRKNGSTVYVSAQLMLLRQGENSQPLVVSTHSDISVQLQMQQELLSANLRLKQMATELERSNEELEEFARIASHDLSAPITTTRWLVDLLSTRHGQQLNEEGQKCLQQISLSLTRMAELVDAVLQHAKVGTTAIGASEEADTELALESALENLRRDVETSGASVQYRRLPPLLIGQQPLTQLFQNLLSNAIKYRRPDAVPVLEISAERTGALWRVAVSDNGLGIETQWRERIFLPMQRLHGAEIAGSGIGLATCRKIVNRAGGRVWVEANPKGVGSTFYFTLPSLADKST